MEVIRKKIMYLQHSWRKDKDGNIDESAWDNDYHSGVICEKCHECICTSCEDYTKCDTECSVSWDECPHCHEHLVMLDGTQYCYKCGNKIEYNEDSLEQVVYEF